jgi:1D-myo-inositol-tetrakisphosphate 5-kinase/inositol-polyphosphate multikinase
MSHTDQLSSQASATHALSSQVGGHPGVLTTEDGSLLIKPALAPEVAFYQTAAAEPALAPLRPFLPRFLGTLKLEGKVETANGQQSLVPAPTTEGHEGHEKDECRFGCEVSRM